MASARTEFRNIDGVVVGSVTLDATGSVLFPAGALGENVAATNVICPGPQGPVIVRPADGSRYLRALPFTFRSPYLHAVFVGD